MTKRFNRFFADVSPVDSRVVYVSCEYVHEDASYPDGSRDYRRYELAVIDRDGTNKRRLTDTPAVEDSPVWSPDGRRIAYFKLRNPTSTRPSGLYTMASDSSDERLVTTGSRTPGDALPYSFAPLLFPPAWSPDGNYLALLGRGADPTHLGDVYTIGTDGTQAHLVGKTTALPSWSPDGEELVFATRTGDTTSVEIASRDGSNRRTIWQGPLFGRGLYKHPVLRVAWSPTGDEIVFVGDAVYIIRADGSEFRRLARPEFGRTALVDWSPDGTYLAVSTQCQGPLVTWQELGPYCGFGQVQYLTVVKPDGSGFRLLSSHDIDNSNPWHRWSLGPPREPGDPRVCSNGIVVPEPEAHPGLVRDCEVLMRVRHTIEGGGTPLPWDGETPIDQWQGVRVEPTRTEERELRVRRLVLGIDGLAGTLPPEISLLTELSTLGFSGNALTGSVPREWGNLSELRLLSLTGTGLSGNLPAELGNLSKLVRLWVFDNHFSGRIPAELGNLAYLQEIILNNNNLEGHIPFELGGLANLEYLDFTGNFLSGEIPSTLGNLPELHILKLSANQLTGNVPFELVQLSLEQVIGIELWSNNLTGCIAVAWPDMWVEATGLERCTTEQGGPSTGLVPPQILGPIGMPPQSQT